MIKLTFTTLRASMALLLIIAATACSSTAEITYSNVHPDATNKNLRGVMVIGVATNNTDRVDYEKAFTQELQRKGVHALASYTLVAGKKITAQQATDTANKNDLDTILVVRYVGESQVEIYHPGTRYYDVAPTYGPRGRGFGGYYGHAYEVAYDPAVYSTNRTITLVSDLYEVSTEKALWTAVSDSIKAGNEKELRDSFVKAFISNLQEHHLIR
jgi:hypothetical protein